MEESTESATMTTPPGIEVRSGWFDEDFGNYGHCRVCGSEHLLHEDCEECGKG